MNGAPIHVRLSTGFPEWPLLRQTPGAAGRWGDCVFHVDEPLETCDWWVVYDALPEAQSTRCPPDHTVFVTGEPPPVRAYDPAFLAQFAHVLTCDPKIDHPGVIHGPQGLPWHAGVEHGGGGRPRASLGYDELAAMPEVTKTKDISVLCSAKRLTAGHRLRLRFLRRLRAHFGGRLDVFGRGIREVPDKWEAVAPYRYHVCFENCAIPDYFTESITDAWLGFALPIYWGCTNLGAHVPADAFVAIDIRDPARAIATIESTLGDGLYEQRAAALREARTQVLDRHNLFARLASLCSAKAPGAADRISLVPESPPARPWIRRVGGRVRSLLRRSHEGSR